MTLSILIPTIGRDSLRPLLRSLKEQLATGDEILVLGDGARPAAHAIAREFGVTYSESVAPVGAWGHKLREMLQTRATGDYVWHLDDDDFPIPDALSTIHRVTTEKPGQVLVFRMLTRQDALVWIKPILCYGNVSGQQLVVPRTLAWSHWPTVYSGDFAWVVNTIINAGGCVWVDKVIAAQTKRAREAHDLPQAEPLVMDWIGGPE